MSTYNAKYFMHPAIFDKVFFTNAIFLLRGGMNTTLPPYMIALKLFTKIFIN